MTIAFLLSNSLLVLAGIPLLAQIRSASRRSLCTPWDLATSYILGELLCITCMLLSSLVGISFSPYLLAVILCCTWFLPKSSRIELRQENRFHYWQWYLLSALLVLFALRHLGEAIYTPLAAWDARSIWFFHAKAFYFDSGITLEYLKNPNYLWSHPNYPPAIPLLACYHALFLGEWHEVYAKSFMSLHWISVILAIQGTLLHRGVNPIVAGSALLLIDILMGENCAIGYADAFFASMLMLAICSKERALRILLLGYCSLIKLEALPYIAIYQGIRALIARLSKSAVRETIVVFGLSCAWPLFCYVNGIRSEYSWSLSSILEPTFTTQCALVMTYALNWNLENLGIAGCTVLAVAAVVPVLYAILNSHKELLLVSLTYIASIPMVLLIYSASPLPVSWLLSNSFDRVWQTVLILGVTSLLVWSAIAGSTRTK